jgi:hypothetical protein
VKRVYGLLAATALLWPLAVMQIAESAMARAQWAGTTLGAVQRAPAPSPPAPSWSTEPSAVSGAFEQLPGDASVFGANPRGSGGASGSKAGASGRRVPARKPGHTASSALSPKLGIRVPAQTVLRLANAKAVPQGTFVAAEQGRPAGMRLQGVSAYGVGLRDGDVLTQVGGAPATSRSDVVGAVLQARAARAPAISAIFWREGEPWRLLVEMPYLKGG